jgi:uncharacterized Zn finger protein (UPF0148 family)
MINQPVRGAIHMVLVDCPLCDRPADYLEPEGTLDCPSCGVRLALAEEAGERASLPSAA